MGKRKNKNRSSSWSKPRATGKGAPTPKPSPFEIPRPDTTRPPVHVDASGQRAPDPLQVLGFDPDAAPSKDEVQERARELLIETPPERDEGRARAILDARARLTESSGAPERLWGELRVPDPRVLIPGFEGREPVDSNGDEDDVEWPAQSRLAALLTLYALVEEEIEGPRQDPSPGLTQAELF